MAARRLPHPGPRAEPRREAVAARLVPVEGRLEPGRTVMAEVARLVAEAGCAGGVLSLAGGRCAPFRYVLPAAATDGLHAAWYSATLAPPQGAAILAATAIVGSREGAPFLHCHGLWDTGEGGDPRMGHMLPFECQIDEPVAVRGWGSTEATFEALPDAETAFTLFSARRTGAAPADRGRRGLFLRLRPDEDVVGAIEAAAREAGIAEGVVEGIGSINEVRFEAGPLVRCHATEIAVEEGRIERGRARLDVAVVDVAGAVRRGRLLRGDNPVGVTFEIVIAGPPETGP